MAVKTFSRELMKEAIERGLVRSRKHPDLDLFLLSYTQDTVAGHVWTDETRAARSLVVDDYFNVVSACIPKFFNDFQEAESLKEDGFEVYEKLDGSLISLFLHEGRLIIRSKSVWDSPLINQVRDFCETFRVSEILQEGYTYVCEWIHPLNRHVVDYGSRVDLVLLAVIDNENTTRQGSPEEVTGWTHGRAKKINLNDAATTEALKTAIPQGEEGWILWNRDTNVRTKIKSPEYLQLHRVKFNLTPKVMLDMIMEGNEAKIERLMESITNLDEQTQEILKYVFHSIISDINKTYTDIKAVYNKTKHIEDRKEFAQTVLEYGQPIAGGCFILRDGRSIDQYIARGADLKRYEQVVETYKIPEDEVQND